MSRAPRANARDSLGMARTVNVLRDAAVTLDKTSSTHTAQIAALEAQLAAMAAAPAPEAPASEELDVDFQQGNAVFDGDDYLYVSYQDTEAAYTAHRYYFNGAGESQDDAVTGSGDAPATLVEFAAEAWPIPVP